MRHEFEPDAVVGHTGLSWRRSFDLGRLLGSKALLARQKLAARV